MVLDPTKFPKRPAKMQCPSRACLIVLEVSDCEDDLPAHDSPDGLRCNFVGQGLFVEWL